MEYFGIDEKVLYPSSSFLSTANIEPKPKRSLGKLRDNVNNVKGKVRDEFKDERAQLRRNLSKKRPERPTTTLIRKEVNAMWNEALKEERNHIREHSPDRVSRITALSNAQGLGANNKRYQEPQSFGKRTDMNLEFSIPMPVEKKKGTLFRNSNGNRRKIFSKTWWSQVPIGAYLFFLGFLFFPLWYVGAFCQFRKDNTVEAEIERNKSKKTTKSTSKSNNSNEWKSKIDKNKTNNGNIDESHVDFSEMEDPENSSTWNWGLGGVGGEPDAINVNFMSGIEEFEKHKLAENEKYWRKLNILMSVIVTIFLGGLLIIKRKSIFGGGDNKSSTSSSSSSSNKVNTINSGDYKSNNESNGNNNNNNGNTSINNNTNGNNKIPLNNNPNRNGDGGELNDQVMN